MLRGIKLGWQAWAGSLSILARSPVYVIALAVIAGLWAWAGYEWLWLPESSAWLLALALAWLLALVAIALAVLTGSVASVSRVASGNDKRLSLGRILSFEKRRFGSAALVALAGILVGIALSEIFGWINTHALNTASFLTFHSQHPVSYIVIGEIFWVLEALVWIAFAGFLFTWLLVLSNRREANAPATAAQARPQRPVVFLTGVLGALVFGGLAWRVGTWRPLVKEGGWDYAQLGTRTGAALLLLTLGWLFWTLALARLALAPVTGRSASPPRS